jgi:hypothetical protein
MLVHDVDLGVNVYGDSSLHNKDVSSHDNYRQSFSNEMNMIFGIMLII